MMSKKRKQQIIFNKKVNKKITLVDSNTKLITSNNYIAFKSLSDSQSWSLKKVRA